MKKKILFITHSSNNGGGSEYDFEELLKYFSGKSEDYTVHSLFPKGQNPEYLYPYCEKYGFYRWGFLPSHYIYGLSNYLKYFFKIFDQIRDIKNIIKNEKYDLCVINVVVLIWPILYLAKTQSKVVVFIRENIYPLFLRKLIYKCFNLFKISIIANSETSYNYYKQTTGSVNCDFVYPGIMNFKSDEKILINNNCNIDYINTFKLINLGSIDKLKNQKLIVDSLIEMKKREFKLPYLTFVGYYDKTKKYYTEIMITIRKNSLSKNIRFTGKLNKNEVFKEIKHSNALIISSITEGMPISMLEAMKFGKPVLSTKVGGIPEIIINKINGLLFDNNPKEVALIIHEIMSDKLLYKKLSENSNITFQKSFNLQNSLFKTEKIFQRIMNQ